jgi:hypothetical protein
MNYIDPDGHLPCVNGTYTCNNPHNTDPKPKNPGQNNDNKNPPFDDSLGGNNDANQNGQSNHQNSPIAEEDNQNWLEIILGWKETPLVMAAIQVLSIDGIPLITGIMSEIGPGDLAIALACFAASRGAAVTGTASTLYQYHNNLYGTQKIDAIESIVTTITGSIPIPVIFLTSVHLNLFYTAYRYFGGGF